MKKLLLLLSATLIMGCTAQTQQEDFSPEAMLKIGADKVLKASVNYTDPEQLPRFIDHGDTQWSTVKVRDWTSGFYPGVLWLAYEVLNDEALRAKAEAFTQTLSAIAYGTAGDHDIGFMTYLSYGNGYRLTGNPEYKKALLSAADTLATLYNPKVGSIHSWPFNKTYEHNTIVDNMMNLELLFWAAKNGGDKRLEDIAISHAEVTQKYIVRPDGSAYHLGEFTSEGEFVRGVAHQGYADNSMWARGQAWGIYGFAVVYRECRREEFLATSMKMADIFLKRLPEDVIPFWDFDYPDIPNAAKDASAAAVAAGGLLELYNLVEDRQIAEGYYQSAVKLLEALSTEKYISADTDAILAHSTGHHPKGYEVDVPIIYADYYYLDALFKLKRINEKR